MHRNSRWLLSLSLLSALAVASCKETAPPTPPEPVTTAPPKPPSLEGTGVDDANVDRAVDPCDNFYQYACGGWLKRTEIPADQSRWGSFSQIDERNKLLLRSTLEDDAAGKANSTDPYTGKLGAWWAACMDEAKIETTADADLKAALAPIDAIKTFPQVVDQMAVMFLTIANPVFELRAEQDFKDATQMIASLDQGGIGLPDRDYYFKDDEKSKDLRAKYVAHVAKMFELAGEPAAQAKTDADTVMKIETELAGASLTRVDRRDPNKVYHRINLAGIEKTAPKFPWKAYFKKLGHADIAQINVAVPEFFAKVNALVGTVKIPEWKTYLRWNAIHGATPQLSKKFVDENFAFYGKTLNGQQELKPRWKRCVESADRGLGEALAASFVRKTFGAEGKEKTLQMVHDIEAAMRADLAGLTWMDDATRKNAVEKLENIANKIGYPDKWRNYDALTITRDSYLKNAMAAGEFEEHRQLNKIGKPVDRGEFDMTPPTVNAYYNPSMNEMVFPAGILQHPFYDNKSLMSVNYGAIGMVMGHELTHGFDDEGRQFDAKGNLREWWTPTVGKEFERRAECVVQQYNGYVAVDDLHINGKLTLGENIADLGGMKLAYRALALARERLKQTAPRPGFTDEQLFFLGYAQAWCSKTRPENARMRVTTDPHSPPENRVNGPLSNLPEFAAAFQCKPGSKMVRAEQCTIW